MEGVQFEEKTYISNNRAAYYQNNQESTMVKLLIKSGLAKNRKQANIFLLASILVFALTSAFLFATTNEAEPTAVPYLELSEAEKNKIPVDERLFIERNLQNVK